jgi:hypothetical protein
MYLKDKEILDKGPQKMTKINQFFHKLRLVVHRRKHKELAVQDKTTQTFIYTEEQLMARLKFFIGICLALTLTGIVFVVLYSIIFVTQPLNAISPIDQKFFELTGTLSGIMLAGHSKEDQEAMLAAQKNAQIAADSAKTPKTDNNSGSKFNTSSPNAFSTGAQWNPQPAAATNSWGSQTLTPSPALFTVPVMTTASGKKIIPDEEQPLI